VLQKWPPAEAKATPQPKEPIKVIREKEAPIAKVANKAVDETKVQKNLEEPMIQKIIAEPKAQMVEPEPIKKPLEIQPVAKITEVTSLPEPVAIPASIPAPTAFQNTRQTSEDEWETGSRDGDEQVTVPKSDAKPFQTKVQEVAPPLQTQQATVNEEEALREQLAKELEEDDEPAYSAVALYDYQAGL